MYQEGLEALELIKLADGGSGGADGAAGDNDQLADVLSGANWR